MANIQEQFDKFYENIKLTSLQRDDVKKKYDGVCKKLHDNYYPNKQYDGSTKLLIGSYGKDTHIRPARDVDVIFKLPPSLFKQYDDYESNGQSQLLQDVKKILQEKYPDTPIKAFGKVVVLEFSESNHNVELLPAWEKEDGSFTIPNTENSGSWENWNPRAEINKIKDSNDKTGGKTKFLIRSIKKWAKNCSIKLKSYKIENGVVAFLESYDSNEKNYSKIVHDFFKYLCCSADKDSKSHIETAVKRSVKALDFERDDKLDCAVEEWRKIFGGDFPSLPKKKLTSENYTEDKIRSLMEQYPSSKEEFLLKDYGIETKINPEYIFKIDAEVSQNGFRINSLSNFIFRKIPLRKKKSLTFKVIKNNVPGLYDIKWKVRNFGEEAQKANDLRGEITPDALREEKKENTKYYGEHYVECYAIKDNVCVAMDKILVPIGSEL